MLTTMFACSRMAGWTSRIIEQYELNRLMRPLRDYVGTPNVEYVPIGKKDKKSTTCIPSYAQ
jgi:citrate synthase